MILDLLATLVWKLNQRAARKRVAASGTFTVAGLHPTNYTTNYTTLKLQNDR